MCDLCKESYDGVGELCQGCGRLICCDVRLGDDVLRPAYVTAGGDLCCDVCGSAQDRDEEEELDADAADARPIPPT